MKRLYRSRSNAVIGGVCGGIGEYFSVDPILVRLAWVLTIFLGGAGLFAYIVAWLIIPSNPGQEWDDDWHWSTRVRQEGAAGGAVPEGVVDPQYQPTSSTVRRSHSDGPRTFGLILVLVGGFLLVRNFLPHFALGRLWPLLLIGIGVVIVLGAFRGDR